MVIADFLTHLDISDDYKLKRQTIYTFEYLYMSLTLEKKRFPFEENNLSYLIPEYAQGVPHNTIFLYRNKVNLYASRI